MPALWPELVSGFAALSNYKTSHDTCLLAYMYILQIYILATQTDKDRVGLNRKLSVICIILHWHCLYTVPVPL